MGEKNGGRDRRALTGSGMRSAVLPQRALRRRGAPAGAGGDHGAAGAAVRGADPVARSAQTPGGRAAVWFFLGTELVYPRCKHYWQQIGVV